MSDGKPAVGMFRALAAKVNDGWVNIWTGLGSALKDKRTGAEAQFELMAELDAETLYGVDDTAATIVDAVPEDALREWLTFHADEGDESLPALVEKELERLGAHEKLKEAWTWSRLYGGAGILLNVDDSLDLEEPLNLNAIRKINSLTVLSRWELQITTSDMELNVLSPRYGKPNVYRFAPRRGGTAGSGKKIHHTRILRFDGVALPMRLFIANHYWGDSVLNRTRNAIRNYNQAHDSAAAIMTEFNQGVFTMKGLADMLANGKDDLVQARIQTAQMGRSVCRAMVIDEGETFTNVGAALSGVPEVLDRIDNRLVVASKMPHTKILGDSPSGLGASGESEKGTWYDYVASQREVICRPKVHALIQIILRSKQGPTKGVEPEKWNFEFAPLQQVNEAEQADIRLKIAQTDEIYLRNNVVDPDEVAASRFGTGKYSAETTLDLESREKPDGQRAGGEGAPDGRRADEGKPGGDKSVAGAT